MSACSKRQLTDTRAASGLLPHVWFDWLVWVDTGQLTHPMCSSFRHPFGHWQKAHPLPSTNGSLQTSSRDGISDGILAAFESLAYVARCFAAGLNIIARYVERMLGAFQGGYKSLK